MPTTGDFFTKHLLQAAIQDSSLPLGYTQSCAGRPNTGTWQTNDAGPVNSEHRQFGLDAPRSAENKAQYEPAQQPAGRQYKQHERARLGRTKDLAGPGQSPAGYAALVAVTSAKKKRLKPGRLSMSFFLGYTLIS